MAHFGGGGMGGIGIGRGGPSGFQRLKGGYDGWGDEEFGAVYSHDVVMRLLGYLRPFKGRVALAVFATFIYIVTARYQPILVRDLIDSASRGDLGGVNRAGILFILLALGAWVSYYVQLLNTGWIGHRVLFTLRTQMFNHYQKLSLRFYDNNEVGKVMSRVTSDVSTLQELLSSGLITILADFGGLFFVIALMLFLDVQLTLVTLAIVPFLVGGMLVWQSYARRAFVRVRQAIAVVNASLQENVSGVRVIQSLSRESESSRRFDDVNKGNFAANVSAGRITAAVLPMVELSVAVATATVIIFGGFKALNGSMSPGTLVAFTLLVQGFFEPVRTLTMQYTQLQRAMAGGERIFEVLDTVPEIQDAPDAIELEDVRGEVTFEHVGHSYVDGVPVLRDFNLAVQAGETIAIVGPTGAGKTTVTALVARFYDASEGRVLIDGHDIRKVKRQSLARRMGLVLQEPFLFSGTVIQNIRYGRRDAPLEDVERAATAVGAHDFIMRLEHGYDTELQERGQNLSVGQRQLLAFARAVLADPRILILDEATANVDTRTEAVIQKALKELLRGRTSFVIAHRLSTIRNADRIVVMEDGRIAEQGTHDELLALGGLYAKLYQMTYQERNGGSEANAGVPASRTTT
ncbi:MAG: ABC transporter ATP-binding protein [Chloroflexi bacterium]|nr:ABC transporter ATP-binding protein [Chloroflexota bacterium]